MYTIITLLLIVLLGIIIIKYKEGFLPDYSDYNSVDRIKVGKNYAYCIGGNVTCSGKMNKMNYGYKGGNTYSCDNSMQCNNFVSELLEIEKDISGDTYLWNTPNGIYFPFSTIYSGFTKPSSYIPITLNGNYYNIYDTSNNIIDTMNKCEIINDTYRCKMATHSLDSSYNFGDASFVESTFGEAEIIYDYGSTIKNEKCIADYGGQIGDNICNGEFGLLKDTAFTCPYYKPKCDFKCGTTLGNCNYNSKIVK